MSEISCSNWPFNEECMDFISQKLRTKCSVANELERHLEEKFRRGAVAANSAGAALHLALLAINLKRGDKVICPVNAFPIAAAAVRSFDAEPIFCDCRTDDYNICADALERVLASAACKKLRAVIVHHHSGNAADMQAICELAARYGIYVINDLEQASHLRVQGEFVASQQAISCMSFADFDQAPAATGGSVLFKDPKLFERARLLGKNALERTSWDEGGQIGYFYDVKNIGFDYACGALSAAVALYTLENEERFFARRKQISELYNEQLAGLKHIALPQFAEGSARTNYVIRVDKNRDNFARALKERGVLTRIHFIPANFLSYYKQKYGLKVTEFSGALSVYSQVLSLPLHSGLSDGEVERVIAAVRELDAQWV